MNIHDGSCPIRKKNTAKCTLYRRESLALLKLIIIKEKETGSCENEPSAENYQVIDRSDKNFPIFNYVSH